MEQLETESALDTSDVNPTDSGQNSILGKFTSVDELAKAYEQLQSAFTKKSQEYSALRKDAERQAAELKDKASVAVTQKVETIPQIPPVISGHSGSFAFTNVSEARTLHATTKVAENFFKLKGERIK